MSSVPARIGIFAATVLALLAGPARADEMQIKARIVHLRAKPSDDARIKLKLGGGRSVAVVGQSPDGQWVHVRVEVEKGPDSIPFDGWVALAELRGEKVLATEGGRAPSTSPTEAAPRSPDTGWSDGGASSGSSGSGAGTASGDSGWGDPAADAGKVAWDGDDKASSSDSKTAKGDDDSFGDDKKSAAGGDRSKAGSTASSDDPWAAPSSSGGSSGSSDGGSSGGATDGW